MDRELIFGEMDGNSKANLWVAKKRVKVAFGAQICPNMWVNFGKTKSRGNIFGDRMQSFNLLALKTEDYLFAVSE